MNRKHTDPSGGFKQLEAMFGAAALDVSLDLRGLLEEPEEPDTCELSDPEGTGRPCT